MIFRIYSSRSQFFKEAVNPPTRLGLYNLRAKTKKKTRGEPSRKRNDRFNHGDFLEQGASVS